MMQQRYSSPIYTLGAALVILVAFLYGCASKVSPSGGPYDTTPPRLIKATPAAGATQVKKGRVELLFDEYIKIKDPSKRVIISPPQLQMPRITAIGKRVVVELEDTLIANTTYTIDFTDAIVDNNEETPLEAFAFAFATGDVIDTMELAGTLIDARTLEPMPGVVVGVHPASSDRTAFRDTTLLRMSRTSDRSRFVIRNMQQGRYRLFALKESDGNYRYDNPTDGIAFTDSAYLTTSMPAMRNDTIWRDSLTIDTITPVKYTRYLPDDLVLRYFTGSTLRRYFTKRERKDSLTLSFEYNLAPTAPLRIRPIGAAWRETPSDSIPGFTLDQNGLVTTVFLTDRTWAKSDSFAVTYLTADTLELPVWTTDSLVLRVPKPKESPNEKSKKKDESLTAPQDSLQQATKPIESPLKLTAEIKGNGGTADTLLFTSTLPIDTAALKGFALFSKQDSILTPVPGIEVTLLKGSTLRGMVTAPWRHKQIYELHADTLLFKDLYGNRLNKPFIFEVTIKDSREFSQLELELEGVESPQYIFELLDTSDKVVRVLPTTKPTALFKDLTPGKYGARVILDSNGDGDWTPGDYLAARQPEMVYYLPKIVEVMKNWKVKEHWKPLDTPLEKQKPTDLIRTKPTDKKRRDLNKQYEEEQRNRARGGSANGGMGGLGGMGGGIGSALGGLRQTTR